MKDEIKEIEEWLRDISTPTGLSYSGDRTLSNSMVDHIIDYITNLQEGNHNLLDEIEDMQNKNNKLIERNEKAIEYIKAVGVRPKEINSFVLLNILQGDDKDE